LQTPLKIPRVCDTRWLSIEPTVTRITHQWSELKLHFALAAGEEKCHKAKILHELYCDDVNLLYLLFLKPILSDMRKLNKIFQSVRSESTKLLNELITSINSLKEKIIPPDIQIDILNEDITHIAVENLYLGYAYLQLKTCCELIKIYLILLKYLNILKSQILMNINLKWIKFI